MFINKLGKKAIPKTPRPTAIQPQIKRALPTYTVFLTASPQCISVASEETGSLSSRRSHSIMLPSLGELNISLIHRRRRQNLYTVAAYGCIISTGRAYCASALNARAEMTHVMSTIMKHVTEIQVFLIEFDSMIIPSHKTRFKLNST